MKARQGLGVRCGCLAARSLERVPDQTWELRRRPANANVAGYRLVSAFKAVSAVRATCWKVLTKERLKSSRHGGAVQPLYAPSRGCKSPALPTRRNHRAYMIDNDLPETGTSLFAIRNSIVATQYRCECPGAHLETSSMEQDAS